MTTETVETPDTSFADGFNSVRSGVPLPPMAAESAPPAETTPEPVKPPTEPPAAPAEAEIPAEVLDAIANDESVIPGLKGYTPEQVTSLLAKMGDIDTIKSAVEKLNGRTGSLMEDVGKLKTAPPVAPTIPAAHPGNGKVLPEVDANEVEEAYPDLAAYTKRQIADAIKVGQLPPDIAERIAAQEARDAERDKREAEAYIETQKDIVALKHEDWEDVVSSDPYKVWVQAQPEDVQARAKTHSGRVLSGVITAYKDFNSKQQAKDDKSATNRRRLEESLTPSTVPGNKPTEPTEHDAFKAGFESVAKARAGAQK